jgi:hypothetical protein
VLAPPTTIGEVVGEAPVVLDDVEAAFQLGYGTVKEVAVGIVYVGLTKVGV